MSETWFLVIRSADGTLESSGTVVADPLPAGLTAVQLSDADAEAWRGGEKRWDSGTQAVVAVTPPVPSTVTRWRLRKALLVLYGITPANVESFIVANTTEGTERELALIDWRDSPTVRRDHPLITPFVAYLSAAREETIDADEFFRYAAALE